MSTIKRDDVVTVVRVCYSGERETWVLSPELAEAEVLYCRQARPDCALFVGAECVQAGFLEMDRLVAIGRELAGG